MDETSGSPQRENSEKRSRLWGTAGTLDHLSHGKFGNTIYCAGISWAVGDRLYRGGSGFYSFRGGRKKISVVKVSELKWMESRVHH